MSVLRMTMRRGAIGVAGDAGPPSDDGGRPFALAVEGAHGDDDQARRVAGSWRRHGTRVRRPAESPSGPARRGRLVDGHSPRASARRARRRCRARAPRCPVRQAGCRDQTDVTSPDDCQLHITKRIASDAAAEPGDAAEPSRRLGRLSSRASRGDAAAEPASRTTQQPSQPGRSPPWPSPICRPQETLSRRISVEPSHRRAEIALMANCGRSRTVSGCPRCRPRA